MNIEHPPRYPASQRPRAFQEVDTAHRCGNCGFIFSTAGHLSQHVNASNLQCPFVCSTCDKLFVSHRGLVERWVQSPKHAYCQRCDTHFDSDDELGEHRQLTHYPCKVDGCRKIFDFRREVEEHYRQSTRLGHGRDARRVGN